MLPVCLPRGQCELWFVVGLAHELRDALFDPRLLLAERAQLAAARLAPTLTQLLDRPSEVANIRSDRTNIEPVNMCRFCAEMQRFIPSECAASRAVRAATCRCSYPLNEPPTSTRGPATAST
jgi:hypothetical protein